MSIKEKPRRVPKFKSYEEEAEFWDAYSPEDFPEEFQDVEAEFASSLIRGERDLEERRKLIDALSALSDDERQVLTMVLLGLGASEIVRVTGWSESRCRRALNRARRRAGRLISE